MNYKLLEQELLQVKADANVELLEADMVWQWAQSHKKSYLHTLFPWNKDVAAKAHWQQLARRYIKIVFVGRDVPVRKWVSLSIDRTNGGGYRDREIVLKQPSHREIMIADLKAEFIRLRQCNADLGDDPELAMIFATIDKLAISQLKAQPRNQGELHAQVPAQSPRPRPSPAA